MQDFTDNGFLGLPGFFQAAELAELQQNVSRFLEDVLPKLPSEHVFYEERGNQATLKQIQQLGEHDAWIAQLVSQGRVPRLAEQLLGARAIPRNIQYFNKPPSIGKPTPPHQDGHYFMLDPCEAVTMWLALDDVDEQNGCVRYSAGSHRRGMREHAPTGTLGFSRGITDYPQPADLENEVACPARPGDLLVHHAMTIHRADNNQTTDRPRRALGFIFYSERAREDAAAHAAYQRDLAARLRTDGLIE
jgi:phytanoyl-CoA hydroxylase